MQASTRRDQAAEIVARVLRLEVSEVGPDGRMDVTPKWDSLAQLSILTAIEQECGVSIEPEDAVELTSVPALAEFLEKVSPQ